MKIILLFSAVLCCAQLNAQTTVFQSDFSNPSSYQLFTASSGNWIVTGNAPQGVNSQYMGALNSTTSNEFAMYDSDFLGTPGMTQTAIIAMTAPVDISGYAYAYVCLESYYKHNTGECTLNISTDGASTWTNYTIHGNLAQGDSSANPSAQLIDVSAAAGNEASVLLSFTYDGDPGYAWMIDDVCVLANNSPILGLDETPDLSFKVYPNPTDGEFTIDLHKFHEDVEVKITDLQGRLLKSEIASSSMFTLDVQLDDAPGTYFVTVVHANGESTSALVKK